MARRRRRVRSIGAVIVNPPRRSRKAGGAKRRKAAKKAAATRKRNKSKRSRAAKKGARARKRRKNPGTKRRRVTRRRKTVSRRRKVARRRNPSRKRRVTRRRRRTKAKRRKNPSRKRRVVRRRKKYARRRNPGMMGGLASSLKKIPLIGGPLAVVAGVAPFAVPAALAVELPMRASTFIMGQGWIPAPLKTVPGYFLLMGALGAVAAHMFIPGSPQTKKLAAVAVASSLWGVAFYEQRMQMMGNSVGVPTVVQAIAEDVAVPGDGLSGLGALMLSSKGDYGAVSVQGQDYGMAPAYTVGPQGYGSPFGAVVVGG